MPGTIISIVNFKGGVGKTTVSVNVAACIAQQHPDKKVALIDLDPQSNASIWMLAADRWNEFNRPDRIDSTSFAMFRNKVTLKTFEVPYNNQKSDEYLPNLFLLPASYRMMIMERQILDLMAKRKIDGKYQPGDEYLFLGKVSKHLREWFDHVLIDCPPNLYMATLNAICHSDYILIPCVPDALSTSGFTILVEEIRSAVTSLKSRLKSYKPPSALGVVITKFEPRTTEHNKGVEVIQARIEELRKDDNLFMTEKTTVFDRDKDSFRDYMVHAEAVQAGLPLCLCAPKMKAYQDVSNFTASFLAALEP